MRDFGGQMGRDGRRYVRNARHRDAAADEAASLAAQLDTSFLTIATHGLAAATFLETGEPDRALEQVRLTGSKLDPGRHALLLLVAAGAEAALGRPEVAAQRFRQGQAHAPAGPVRASRGPHLSARMDRRLRATHGESTRP